MRAAAGPSSVAVAILGAGLVAYLTLHLAEPRLAITWSYAHLSRRAGLRELALALVVVLPLAASLLLRSPRLRAPARSWSPAFALPAMAALGLALLWVTTRLPVAQLGGDRGFYLLAVNDGRPISRWSLTCWGVHALIARFVAVPAPATDMGPVLVAAQTVNLVAGVVTLAALAGAARVVSASLGEAIVTTLLVWSTFGVLQISAGYLDVYPIVAALLALYLWTGVRTFAGEVHPAFPLVLAAVGPFFYEGLLLTWPSALLLGAVVARTTDGGPRVRTALAIAVVAAGLATVPVYRVPFAWWRFVADVAQQDGAVAFGYSPTSSLIPWPYLATVTHAREVLHTLLLVDGVGVLSVLVLGPSLVREVARDAGLAFVASIVLPFLVFVVVMDPVFGAFADWDLFSYGACATSLLGAALLVRFGRGSTLAAALVGLALAANVVHLLARFHALEVDAVRHLVESPRHVPG
ncbi:MAG TPA: hypothetical protein VMS22_00840 [Candidatus Eisenbacteria bacterium]|nr:hypothetical protein [Candidatus Eisenbacteria bacterium]